MRRRLIAGIAALLVIGALVPLSASSAHACCCRNAHACSMHHLENASGCRIDRCSTGSASAAASVPVARAILVSITLPQPLQQTIVLIAAMMMLLWRATRPVYPPPRFA